MIEQKNNVNKKIKFSESENLKTEKRNKKFASEIFSGEDKTVRKGTKAPSPITSRRAERNINKESKIN